MENASAELLRAVQTRDAQAEAALFARYVPRLRSLVQSRLSRLLARRIDSDDVVQSALRSFFVRASDGEFTADQPGDLWRLLATITVRKLHRSVTHHTAAKRDVRRDAAPELSADADDVAALRSPTPADATAAAEELVWLMRHLAPSARLALQLRLQGHEPQDIAAELNCSERSVRRWLVEARSLMQSRLDEFNRAETPANSVATQIDGLVARQEATLDPHNYVLHRLIGAGGVCKVYVATERSSGRRVCIKVLRRQFRFQKRFVRRVLAERSLTARIKGPGIVPIQGLGCLPDGGYFLVMDLIDGVNLDDWMRSHQPSPTEAAQIVAQVADAVHRAHQAGIIHCDLKPANILLDKANQPWLTDFGFAREIKTVGDCPDFSVPGGKNGTVLFSETVLASEPERAYIAGTAAFLAPEQFDPTARQIGIATDIHGLGAILFTLMAGTPPYAGRTLEMLDSNDFPAPNFDLLAGCPENLIQVCCRCLDRSPANRFPSADAVAVGLRAAIG